MYKEKLKKIGNSTYELLPIGEMRVPVRIFTSTSLLKELDEGAITQLVNVSYLPGIQKAAFGMSDMHIGYGYPIGGVGAFTKQGVISVGGVGFDINCGVRTLRSNLFLKDVKPKIKQLTDQLFRDIPAGLGSRGEIRLTNDQVSEVLIKGSEFVINLGYGKKSDLDFTESYGKVKNANPDNVSELALKREKKQVGTLGSGNHYLEIQYVDEIYDKETAKAWKIDKNQILITLHCGSRALGHQIGTDYLKVLAEASRKYGIPIREKELVCAPITSEEGQKYFTAMNCGINYAFANRQVISHLTRKAFTRVFPKESLEMLYDIGHNTCKIEKHEVDGKELELYVHRKGATRAFAPGRDELNSIYKKTGQPIIIGGTMGTSSYLLVGTKEGEEKAFASVCHGSGRAMSRTKAKHQWNGKQVIDELAKKGIYVRCHSFPGLAEEAPMAYKPVDDVVNAIHDAKLARKVLKLKPIGNIKG